MLLTAKIGAGCEINHAINEAINLCKVVGALPFPGMPNIMGLVGDFYDLEATPDESDQCTVRFAFNDVTVSVRADSDLELIYRDWDRALSGYTAKTVGPYPKPELSDEELANDARIEAENEARRQAARDCYNAKQRAHRDRVEARMGNAPAMEFSDENAWLEAVAVYGGNPFGDGILAYAERWARMMQLEISKGNTLEEVWDCTSHEADLEGMSGASQSIATHLLTMSWVHGAELRRLHNAYWGSDATDGTVNPSIIRFDK